MATQTKKTLLAYLMVAAIFVFGATLVEGYTSIFSIRAMLVIASLLIIAAAGQTMVMLIGGIDLSIPFVVGFANVAVAQLSSQGLPFPLAMAIVLVLSFAVGAFNGAISSLLKVHPLIITLGSGTAVLGFVLLWTKGYPTGSAPGYISDFVSIGHSFGPLPVPAVVPVVLLLAVALHLVEHRTVFGRRVFAYGSNPTAAPFVRISSLRIWVICFGFSALAAAITGILLLGFSGAAFADVGRHYLFQTIAAAVIGGTALSGGQGGIAGTVAGALVLTQLNTILIGLGFDQSLVQAFLGVLIVAVVAVYGRQNHLRTTI